MNTTTPNGRVRKSLAEQIDRLDRILDGLADGLNAAVAAAVQEAVRLAVRGALRGAAAALTYCAGPTIASVAAGLWGFAATAAARTERWVQRLLLIPRLGRLAG